MWEFKPFLALDSFGRTWMHSHAQLPTPMLVDSQTVRVFFASRDKRQYSSIGFVDLRIEGDSVTVSRTCEHPVMSPGPLGYFDEHGVFPSCIVRDGDRWLMYFIGWNKGFESPMFYASIGVASSQDGEVFQRLGDAPLLSRSGCDPCLVTSPNVIQYNGRWLMTYVSGIGWFRDDDSRLLSRYHIKLAEGSSPLDWERNGHVAIDLRHGETNAARSSVFEVRKGVLGMWFSFVHSAIGRYRIGYAESTDGLYWHREDAASGISDLPDFGSEMLCYPAVFELDGQRWMLVNGNGFGARGFGIARWKDN
jgi:hypothetical protein